MDLDALVVGAGFGGIYQLLKLKQLNLTVKGIDSASDVGGTWFWNRYPGCMSDSESHLYRYAFDKELLQTSPWPNNYMTRDEVLAYLRSVVDKHGLRPHFQFGTELLGAEWDDGAGRWRCATSTGDVFAARYLVTSLGILNKPNVPAVPGGFARFRGTAVHSARWPEEGLDCRGKRVGIIGCGSSGIQITTAIAPAVAELKCFIRHPQYSVPLGLRAVPAEERADINRRYDDIWATQRALNTAFGYAESTKPAMAASPAERERVFEELWRAGNGFRFMFGGFADITTSADANEEACRFLRAKIASIVRDPARAAALTPHDHYIRRPPADRGYYDSFNLGHVEPVDIRRNPIAGVEEDGIRLQDGTLHQLDVIVFATGFEAVDGSYGGVRDSIRGRDGVALRDKWAAAGGPVAYLGMFVHGFPNLFMVNGPQGPFSNQTIAIESEVDFISRLLGESRAAGDGAVIEVTAEAEADWAKTCDALAGLTLFDKVDNWIVGTNVPGVKPSTRLYYGGLKAYLGLLDDLASRDYEGIRRTYGPSLT